MVASLDSNAVNSGMRIHKEATAKLGQQCARPAADEATACKSKLQAALRNVCTNVQVASDVYKELLTIPAAKRAQLVLDKMGPQSLQKLEPLLARLSQIESTNATP